MKGAGRGAFERSWRPGRASNGVEKSKNAARVCGAPAHRMEKCGAAELERHFRFSHICGAIPGPPDALEKLSPSPFIVAV